MRAEGSRKCRYHRLILATLLAAGAAQFAHGDTIVQTTNVTREIRNSEWVLIAEVVEAKKVGTQDFENRVMVQRVLHGEPEQLEFKLCTAEGMTPGDVMLLAMRSGVQKIDMCDGGIFHSPESGPLILLPVVEPFGPLVGRQVVISEDEARFLGCRVQATVIQSGKGNPMNWPPSHYRRRNHAVPLSELEACIGAGATP